MAKPKVEHPSRLCELNNKLCQHSASSKQPTLLLSHVLASIRTHWYRSRSEALRISFSYFTVNFTLGTGLKMHPHKCRSYNNSYISTAHNSSTFPETSIELWVTRSISRGFLGSVQHASPHCGKGGDPHCGPGSMS